MRLLFQERLHISGDHSLKASDEVFSLWQDVGHDGKDKKASIDNQDWLRLEERLILQFHDRLVKKLSSGSLQSEVNCTTRQVRNESNCTIDVVAHGLNKFACLRLGNHRVLLVTTVERKIDILLRIILHPLSLAFSKLNQIQADLDHYKLHLGYEHLAEFFVR